MWLSGNDTSIFGARKSDSNRIMLIHQYPSKKWTLGYGSSYTGISNITYNTPYNVEAKTAVGEQYLKVDGVTVYEASDSNEYNNDFNMAIFACSYSSNDFRLFASARVYNLCVKNNDTLLGNFIPCYRKSDNEIGMFDTVSQTFYTNQGTGTFLKGDDVFSDEVYGGYVDLVTGEVWADHAMFTVDESNATCTLKTSSRLLFIFPLKYYFSAPSRKGASMCTILPENASTNWNYGYVDNISATATTGNHQLYLNYTGDGDGWSELVGEEATVENVKAYLRNAGFAICATLRTPILMRTLTPQQLQTLKNENTFWSDGDSVEIDYDLAETFDIQKAKRKIIMNQPHVETLTSDAVSFTTDMKAPLKECKVSFSPVQEGEGDPSTTNVRNITGWNGVSVKNGENTYSIDWTDDVGTVYGGYVDLVKGELVATYYSFILDGINYFVSSGGQTYTGTDGSLLAAAYDYISNNSFKDLPMGVIDSIPNSISNKYLVTGNHKIIGIQTVNAGTPYYRLVVDASELDDISNSTAIINSLKIWLQNNPIQICYKLAEPIHYQLTPEQILSLKGINNFSCGIKNDMIVKYWNHKLSDSTNIAYEAENLTFDGTNYIDTGVYLFSEKNIDRDFEVVIEDLYGSTTSNNTIVCAKYNSTAIGFLIRLYSIKDTSFNGTIFMKSNNHNNITIKRVNGVITIDGEIITNPTVQFTNTVHNHPLVLGCALQDNGTPYRYATGTIGHITVKWL